MKTISTSTQNFTGFNYCLTSFILFVAFLFSVQFANGQQLQGMEEGEYIIRHQENHDHDHSTCVSANERTHLFAAIISNRDSLKRVGELQNISSRSATSFGWPLKNANSITNATNWARTYGISNFVDQNTGSGIRDYNCGNHSYNGHNGTDIFTYPFGWYLMENSLVTIVAAEAGQIIYKSDGNSSYSCDFNSTSDWNSVFIEHADGSIAWYGHMKKNSPTAKSVGQYVSKGEYLGIVGSSGRSTGPHLHLEVYSGQPYNRSNLIDPFSGGCNTLNGASFWDSQRSYKQPRINAIFTHHSSPESGCHDVEEPNFRNDFNPGDRIYFSRYYTDQNFNSASSIKIYKPDGTVWQSWSQNANNDYTASYAYNYFDMPASGPFGTWKYEVTYNGKTLRHNFKYGTGTTTCGIPNKPTVTNLAHNSLTLNWNSISGANSYKVFYWNGSAWVSFATTSNTHLNVVSLNPNTTYYFSISAVCGGNVSDKSTYVKVVTPHTPTCSAPNKPTYTNLAPTTLTLNWNNVSGASTYKVYYWNGSAWAFISSTSNNYMNINSLVPNTTYYFSISATCSYGNSTLSNYLTVKTPANYTCNAPNRPSVTNLTHNTLRLNWNSVTGANSYKVHYWDGSSWIAFGTTANTYFNVASLSANTDYYFSISSICASGESSLSSYKKVTTLTQVTCAKPGKPWVSNLSHNSLKLNWNNVSGASYYELYYWNGSVWSSFGTTTNSYSNVNSLTANTTYYFAVRTICASGYSVLSDYVTVTTNSGYSCGKVYGLYGYNVSSNSCNLAWNSVSGATKYELFYWTGSYWTSFGFSNNNYTPVSGLSANTRYYFTVRAICGSTQGDFADYIDVKTNYSLLNDGGTESIQIGNDGNEMISVPNETTFTTQFTDEANVNEKVNSRSEEETDLVNKFNTIYPNPALSGSNINIELESNYDGQVNISIVGLNGALISQKTVNVTRGHNQISDAAPINSGFYFYTITYENGSKESKRIIVQ